MAYPYYQVPYQPPVYQPPVYQPPVYQQTSQQIQQQTGIMWVDDEREAALFPIAPNNAVALWEKSGKRAYMKKADATGKPTMTVYDLVERAENASDGQKDADGRITSYATKDELSAVVGVVKGFDEAMSGIKADIETMKGDLYGVAGKRRVKKAEADDE